MKKQVVISFAILLFLAVSTVAVVLYGRGYRFVFNQGKPKLSGTGLLVATSLPDGAQVFINGHLTTATDNTINLPSGEYAVKIFKEGYFPWEKRIKIQEEVVAKADATLFPTAPKLESITASGIQNPVADPSETKIAFTTASQSARKNGAYILDMSSRPILTLQSASTQIADDTIDTLSHAMLSWSPDGQQLLGTIQKEQTPTTYLLSSTTFNQTPQDVTATLSTLRAQWDLEKEEKDKARIDTLRTNLRVLISENFSIIAWSPDETKILYSASRSATLPVIIKPRLIGSDATQEERAIQEGSYYIYDLKEDKNYKLDDIKQTPESNPYVKWLANSKNVIYVHDKKIDVIDFDGTNLTTIYAGPFLDNYVFPWPDGSKIVILTNLGNPNITPNLYTISLK